MSPTDDHKIGPTAHYTAYTWHYLGMPYARLFRTDLGAALFWGVRLAGEGALTFVPGVPSMSQYLELRHRLFESAVEAQRPDVVVELGAGLSRRGVTWASRGVSYVEVDLPHMIEAKERLLRDRADAPLRRAISGRLTHAPVDILAEDFDAQLSRWIEGAERPLVMAEGVLSYFAQPERSRLAASVARALEGTGGRFLAECRVRRGEARMALALHALRLGIRLATSGRGARADLDTHEQVQATFLEAGFTRVEALPQDRVPHLSGLDVPARVWACGFSGGC